MGTQNIIYKQGKIKYELGGGMGSWAKETTFLHPKVNLGDTRVIKGVLMYAYSIHLTSGFFNYTVHWCPVDSQLNDWSKLREWVLKYD